MSVFRSRHLIGALGLAVFILGLIASPAMAAPTWGVSLTNSPETLPRSDERMEYKVEVSNASTLSPGTTLICDPKGWTGTPAPTFSYQWRRDGVSIGSASGAQTSVYTLQAADQGHSMQCQVTGTNANGSSAVLTTPLVIPPEPAKNPPTFSGAEFGTEVQPIILGSGTAERTCDPPSGRWGTLPAGTLTNGSNQVTDVRTTGGTGLVTDGSPIITEITEVTDRAGVFTVGQTIGSGLNIGVPAGTTIIAVGPTTVELSATPDLITGRRFFDAGPQPFAVGQTITGAGIPPNTTITAISGLNLTLSNPATSTDVVPLAGYPGSGWSFQWLRNGAPIPGATGQTYLPEAGAGEADENKVLQCMAIGANANGAAASISPNSLVGTVATPPANAPAQAPTFTSSERTTGPVSVSIDLPSGSESLIFNVETGGWECQAQQPTASTVGNLTCSNSETRMPEDAYTPIKVVTQLGEDAPEPTGTATATVSGGGAPTASDTATYTFTPGAEFGALPGSFMAGVFDELGNDHTKAGGHPYRAYTTFGFNVKRSVNNGVVPKESIRDVVVDAPRGFVGNALATPELCGSIEEVLLALCPSRSSVGGIDIYTDVNASPLPNMYQLPPQFPDNPIYSIEPEFGRPAQFAFNVVTGLEDNIPYTFVPELRADEGYAVSFRTAPIVTQPPLWGTNVNLCDFGARLKGGGASKKFDQCIEADDPDAYPNPLITNPTRCSGPPPTAGLKIASWQHPAEIKTYDFSAPAITECEDVEFTPEAELQPTNRQADTPTGLTVEIKVPIDGVLSPTGVSQSNVDTVTVTLPKGMSINAASADGLEACSLAQIKLKSNAEDECPESSKVGNIEIDTPLIRETLTGDIYVARQNENPFNSTLGLYMAFDSKRDGVRIKVAGKLVPDPVTGQLTSVFTENPEAPFSRLAINFNQGPRSPLVNPPKCGTYAIHSEFSPWSAVNPANPTPDEIVSDDSIYQVTSGPNGSPCPNGVLQPKLQSGLQGTQAGAKSPFVFTLSRDDGTQRFNKIDVTTPSGLTAYLKGIPYCPDNVLAGISGEEGTGKAELANPSCPAASQVGTSNAGAGSGPFPYYAPGKVYLAGPYRGAPVSLAVVTPATAGPFDLGNVVVRNPLYVDPVTSQVKTESDPIPTILHGIVLNVRDIRVALDRPNFTQAPTNCEPKSVTAHVSGQEGSDASVSNRFQVGGCEKLGFKPSIAFRLFGGTHRGSHPRIRATVKTRPGDANFASASVTLPRSEFLDQAHIKTVCTRVQFAAKQCPPGSVYGEAEATTPLLDNPVKGPVYLRSSDNQLPDLVASLRGPDSQPIEVHLDGRIDSINGGIRSSFEVLPDQPVTQFTLTMRGGKKGLLINSRNICAATFRASASFTGQNGKSVSMRPVMRNSCKGKAKKKNKNKKRSHKRNSR